MRRQAPVRGVPKRGKPSLNPVRGKGRGRGKVAPLPSPIRGIKRPGGGKVAPIRGKGKVAPLPMPIRDKGRGRGKVAPPTIDTGKPGRRKPVPLPMPIRGKGKELNISEVKQKKLSPAALKRKRARDQLATFNKANRGSAKKATRTARQARRVG